MRNCIRPDARSIPMVVPYAGGILSGQGMLVGAFLTETFTVPTRFAAFVAELYAETVIVAKPVLRPSRLPFSLTNTTVGLSDVKVSAV